LHRLQSSVAVSGADGRWHLINASPDVTTQIARYLRAELKPAMRSSPVAEIFITNADLDHSLGVFLLREGERLRITAPEGARQALIEGLRMGDVLDSFCGVEWMGAAETWRDLGASLQVRAVPLRDATAPRYAGRAGGVHAVGYLFRDGETGKQAGMFPDVPTLTKELLAIFAECDALFVDGTFWRDDELQQLSVSPRTARDMGHVPILGEGGSLEPLAALGLPLCAYLHINNTNPVLDRDSVERRAVEAAGLRVAEDGMTIKL
jgi:pyrroloquinoline quinone biosynthesis protein B